MTRPPVSMMQDQRSSAPITDACDDAELVRRAIAYEGAAVRAIMQRYNRRLYRIARGILRNDSDAEDAVQEAYIRAFAHLESFRGDSSLGTWLGRIAINEALSRLRARRDTVDLSEFETAPAQAEIIPFPHSARAEDPEKAMAQRQILHLVEQAAARLPEDYRIVFMTRVVEGMSVEETAELLNLRPQTVKTRLHRARRLMRDQIDRQIGPVLLDAFPFAGHRCERMTAHVMARLGLTD